MPRVVMVAGFATKVVNRNEKQGDGKNTAIEFRNKYLIDFDNPTTWGDLSNSIIIDFSGVEKLSPSFADEAFGYFTRYANPEKIKSMFNFRNLTKIQTMILDNELQDAYANIKHKL